ncbi:hypothetical protein [Nocardia sp. NBC_00416]|uniref:hypothetical protein n=1 Tax=Nocardia sp. NBC_00416 TaxID=2975991 RepID=UPI002E235164
MIRILLETAFASAVVAAGVFASDAPASAQTHCGDVYTYTAPNGATMTGRDCKVYDMNGNLLESYFQSMN